MEQKPQSKERLELIARMQEFEKKGKFNDDVSIDPPTIELKPKKIDYLRKNPINKIKTHFANKMASKFIESLIKNNQLIINSINGLENFENLNSGAILTCNHFNAFDNFAIQKVFEKVQKKHQKMWKIIREGNYTNPPAFKFFFRNCDTMPLSSNIHTMMKFLVALKKVLKRGDFALIYPEQAMWLNYRKPRPLKDGAFKFAVKENVPIVPIFITMTDTDTLDNDGFPIQSYDVFISKPIYPDANKTKQENINIMREYNYNCWVDIYEKFYGKKLEYLK